MGWEQGPVPLSLSPLSGAPLVVMALSCLMLYLPHVTSQTWGHFFWSHGTAGTGCAKGFLSSDIDECLSSSCEGHCVNTEGGFVCECGPGMQLSADRHSCQGEWAEGLGVISRLRQVL